MQVEVKLHIYKTVQTKGMDEFFFSIISNLNSEIFLFDISIHNSKQWES